MISPYWVNRFGRWEPTIFFDFGHESRITFKKFTWHFYQAYDEVQLSCDVWLAAAERWQVMWLTLKLGTLRASDPLNNSCRTWLEWPCIQPFFITLLITKTIYVLWMFMPYGRVYLNCEAQLYLFDRICKQFWWKKWQFLHSVDVKRIHKFLLNGHYQSWGLKILFEITNISEKCKINKMHLVAVFVRNHYSGNILLE